MLDYTALNMKFMNLIKCIKNLLNLINLKCILNEKYVSNLATKGKRIKIH